MTKKACVVVSGLLDFWNLGLLLDVSHTRKEGLCVGAIEHRLPRSSKGSLYVATFPQHLFAHHVHPQVRYKILPH